jgi:hypothetical protein
MKDAKQIIRELVEEVIEEMTGTAAVGGSAADVASGKSAGPIRTPAAFRGHKSKKKSTEKSMPGGKVVGKEDTDDTTIGESENESLPTVRRDLNIMEARSRYRNFKESDMMKNHAKISYGISQAKKMLGEVEYLVSICERLKTECGYTNENLWARTQPDMKEIHSRLKEIAKRINRMGK